MARYKLTLCYDGGEYYGFQRQKDLPTIQKSLEEALSKRFQEEITVFASGRTDAGVHAVAQVAHFDTDKEFEPSAFGYSINPLLPKDIAVTSCERVDENFHARFGAKSKTYLYKVCLSKIHSPLKRKYYHICFYDIDVEKMKTACKYFIGEHDFRAFMLADDEKQNTVRTIFRLEVEQKGDELLIWVSGNGFLHNMVRIIAGTLIDVGRGRIAAEDIPKIIESRKHVGTGKTLDACGLYLWSVAY
ncbi:MAG: tRNA pseudouridine(38-40) synthase TruA [Clostridia bacterium]|nr:tRNA pseudouridine(38-40) synthase TruA [Clostridia bacterium]MDE7328256.1 tRNA pseudouridine(38-40) synthase TruA [Clostridia bacterium]